jgi:hypothetical protein
MPIVEATEGGAILAVKVVPGASRERIVGPLVLLRYKRLG